jgi:hypothetical protein
VIEAPSTSPDALMFDYLAFDAAGAGSAASGAMSGKQALVVFLCCSPLVCTACLNVL